MDWCKFLIEGDKYIIVILRIKQEACKVLILRHPADSLAPNQVGGRGGEGRTEATPVTATIHNLHPAYNYIVLDKWINGQEGWLSPRLVLCVYVHRVRY